MPANDIRLIDASDLLWQPFADAQRRYGPDVVIGLRRARGDVLMAPEPELRIEAGDRLVAVTPRA